MGCCESVVAPGATCARRLVSAIIGGCGSAIGDVRTPRTVSAARSSAVSSHSIDLASVLFRCRFESTFQTCKNFGHSIFESSLMFGAWVVRIHPDGGVNLVLVPCSPAAPSFGSWVVRVLPVVTVHLLAVGLFVRTAVSHAARGWIEPSQPILSICCRSACLSGRRSLTWLAGGSSPLI